MGVLRTFIPEGVVGTVRVVPVHPAECGDICGVPRRMRQTDWNSVRNITECWLLQLDDISLPLRSNPKHICAPVHECRSVCFLCMFRYQAHFQYEEGTKVGRVECKRIIEYWAYWAHPHPTDKVFRCELLADNCAMLSLSGGNIPFRQYWIGYAGEEVLLWVHCGWMDYYVGVHEFLPCCSRLDIPHRQIPSNTEQNIHIIRQCLHRLPYNYLPSTQYQLTFHPALRNSYNLLHSVRMLWWSLHHPTYTLCESDYK